METIIRWVGLDNNSQESCRINQTSDRILVESEILGPGLNVQYQIMLGTNWMPTYCELNGHSEDYAFHYIFQRQEDGQWIANGHLDSSFDECDYVDISLTPFTNSLPINNLDLPEMSVKEISVVYFHLYKLSYVR
ncbi:putative glycolipid-binding domain-containing protein [Dyadobacter crusticola]|uniref:putative glycolipid-binding domain-containing protein n=1 Tax=Dyadobacter crusticola TaxID=292407 RepID=UPI0004E24F12